jgi:hypothetical protein
MIRLSPSAAARGLAEELRRRFDLLLEDPAAFRSRALDECARYPEGDLLPFVFPIMGYTNDAIQHPDRAAADRGRVASLLEIAVPSVVGRVRPPDGRLERLENYRHEGVYLGQLALALGCFGLIGGDERWEPALTRIADVLHEALVAADGRPLRSFPYASWPFDTVPILLALRLHDVIRASERSSQVIARHLRWVQECASDPGLGLPYSHLPDDPNAQPVAPRGCDLGFRIWLMTHLDPSYARRLYSSFRRHYWIERVYLAGFAEWPHGEGDTADVDSGPVVHGIGLAATGWGIGAAVCMRDHWRLARLLGELSAARIIFTWFRDRTNDMYPFDARYGTGSLMGDASIFSVIGWTSWGLAGENSPRAGHERGISG